MNPERKREKIGRRNFRHEGRGVDLVNDLDIADELDGLRQVLKPAQERVLAEVAAHPDEEFTRADYEALAHVSRSQAAYDLAELVKLGLVERFGSGRATRYRVVRGGAGRRRKWTSERIRTELSAFCDELGGWPRASEFREAGRGDLYLAASRYGGIDHWAEELGYYEDEVPEPSEPEPGSGESEPRRRVALAGAGLATLAALAILGLLFVGGDRPAPERSLAAAAPPERHDATARPVAEGGGAPDRPGVVLRLVAASGDSSLVVRRDSADGRLLWEGILERGESVRFRGRLWLESRSAEPPRRAPERRPRGAPTAYEHRARHRERDPRLERGAARDPRVRRHRRLRGGTAGCELGIVAAVEPVAFRRRRPGTRSAARSRLRPLARSTWRRVSMVKAWTSVGLLAAVALLPLGAAEGRSDLGSAPPFIIVHVSGDARIERVAR